PILRAANKAPGTTALVVLHADGRPERDDSEEPTFAASWLRAGGLGPRAFHGLRSLPQRLGEGFDSVSAKVGKTLSPQGQCDGSFLGTRVAGPHGIDEIGNRMSGSADRPVLLRCQRQDNARETIEVGPSGAPFRRDVPRHGQPTVGFIVEPVE